MITTNDTKARQDEIFVTGAIHNPVTDVLLITSCRGVPHLNYLVRANEMLGLRWRITFINPCELGTGPNGEVRDLAVELKAKQRDERVLRALREADIAIVEHHQSFGMFNTTRAEGRNIWQFGFAGDLIKIPSWHDVFLLVEDLVRYEGINPLDTEKLIERHKQHLERFLSNCDRSSVPHIREYFRLRYKVKRLFSTFNHPSAALSLEIFWGVASHLNMILPKAFWTEAAKEDLFATPCVVPTERDRELFGIEWK